MGDLLLRRSVKSWMYGCAVVALAATTGATDLRGDVEAALDGLAAEMVADRPADTAAYADLLRAYLDRHPGYYGAAAALIGEDGKVMASPYVHRAAGGYRTLDLAEPSYEIEAQEWLTLPMDAGSGIWTDPYFDEGGGEVWMVTRSVPVFDGDRLFAVVTTDLVVAAPR